jgi:hypothetical protein
VRAEALEGSVVARGEEIDGPCHTGLMLPVFWALDVWAEEDTGPPNTRPLFVVAVGLVAWA